jgi:predicted permease
MRHDIRYAFRMMRSSPLLTSIILLTLALGIGANVAIFTAIDTVLLRPLPVRAPDRLVMLWDALPKLGEQRLPLMAGEYLHHTQHGQAFAQVAGFRSLDVTLTGDRDPERVTAARASASLFPLLGTPPALGRTFSADEDRPGGARVAILSDGVWRSRYGADAAIVGRTIEIDGEPHLVIGVMPPAFTFPLEGAPFVRPAAIWTPLALTDEETRGTGNSFSINVIARLADGVSVAQASDAIARQAAVFRTDHPELYPGKIEVAASAQALRDVLVAPVRPLLLLLLGVVGAVLLVACANVANLLLARSLARRGELAVRAALGATRGRLIRQLLTESVLLASIGGLCGFLVGLAIIRAIRALGPPEIAWSHHLAPDPFALLWTLAVATLTGVVFGLAPALRISRADVTADLRDRSLRGGMGSDHHRLRRVLTVAEIALSVALLIGAGLLLNSFLRVLRVPPGFDAEGTLVARTVFEETRYANVAARLEAEQQLIARLAAVPGVKAAAAASALPLGADTRIGVRVDAQNFSQVQIVSQNLVSPDYFRALAIPIVQGRAFTDRDAVDAPAVVIVTEALARRYWPGENPLGRRLQWGRTRPPFTVVGVVPDIKVSGLDADSVPMVYMAMFQIPDTRPRELSLALSTSGPPQNYAPALRAALSTVDRTLPLFRVSSLREVLSDSLAQRRFSMVMLSAFALVALVLATSGLYATISYITTERTREFGLRMALGAQRSQVLWLVLRQAGLLICVGLAIGIFAAGGLAGVMRGMVYGISPLDPITFAAISLLFGGVALLASFVPAWRAADRDPLRALKAD